MQLAAVVLVFGFTLLFQPLEQFPILWFALFMLLATSAFSVLGINLNTLGGLWCRDHHQKTRITSVRESLGLAGLLIAVLMPSLLQQSLSPRVAFLCMSIVLAVVMAITMMAFNGWYAKYTIPVPSDQRMSIGCLLRSLSKRCKYFLGVYLMSLLASSMPAVLVLFFIRDRLDAENFTGLFLAVYFLAAAAGMPVWYKLSRQYGKYSAWAQSMTLAIVVFIWTFFLSAGDVWQYVLICIFSGIAFGADLSLPPSMLADFIEDEQTQGYASLQFGVLAFIAKLTLALASVMAFTLLELAQFKPDQANGYQALFALSFTYAVLPCLIKLASMVLLLRMSKIDNKG